MLESASRPEASNIPDKIVSFVSNTAGIAHSDTQGYDEYNSGRCHPRRLGYRPSVDGTQAGHTLDDPQKTNFNPGDIRCCPFSVI